MNPETDLDDLDLKEESDEPLAEEKEAAVEKPNPITEAKELVIAVVGRDIPDDDLEQALLAVIHDHFDSLSQNPTHSADLFRIPDLNAKIWDAFHEYENFVHQNKFENIDLAELGKILREKTVPQITRELWDLTISESQ